jgi:hypothetical protein
LAAATLLKEECRTQAIDSKVLPHVISGLSSKYTNIRLAACQCAKSLSRSVSHLRTSLMDSGVATPLVKVYIYIYISKITWNKKSYNMISYFSCYLMKHPLFKQQHVAHYVI